MAYITTAELARALRITDTAETHELLERSIDAATEEIAAALDRDDDDPLPVPVPPVVKSDCLVRSIQWYKSNDTALGTAGSPETGTLLAPTEAFVPRSVVPYKTNWPIA